MDHVADRQTGELIETCTAPNELVAEVHDRMPVILPPELERPWLDLEVEALEALSFLEPYAAVLMKAVAASPLVNSVRNDFRDSSKPSRRSLTHARRGDAPQITQRLRRETAG